MSDDRDPRRTPQRDDVLRIEYDDPNDGRCVAIIVVTHVDATHVHIDRTDTGQMPTSDLFPLARWLRAAEHATVLWPRRMTQLASEHAAPMTWGE